MARGGSKFETRSDYLFPESDPENAVAEVSVELDRPLCVRSQCFRKRRNPDSRKCYRIRTASTDRMRTTGSWQLLLVVLKYFQYFMILCSIKLSCQISAMVCAFGD